MDKQSAHQVICVGLPATWVNGWLAAVGATVMDSRIRLRWTTDGTPVAVLSSAEGCPSELLAESWPTVEFVNDLSIAEHWRGTEPMRRKVSVDVFKERARLARSQANSWALSSTMTDLCVDRSGEVKHAPFDAVGPGTIKWLHHRFQKSHQSVSVNANRIMDSLLGRAERVQDNGLGFDQTRLGSSGDKTDKWTDPIIEQLAFFGLRVLPVRGQGTDERMAGVKKARERQRGWIRERGSGGPFSFYWPAWTKHALNCDAIDALLDAWDPERPRTWEVFGIHGGWRIVRHQKKDRADRTTAFGSERLNP